MASVSLHIGTPKTGTTYIQQTFAANRRYLLSSGITYPAFGRWPSHTPLALAFNFEDSDRHQKWGVTDRDKTRADIARTISAAVKPDSRFILSTESATRLTDEEAASLYEFLQQFFDEITILVYLRRRDFMLTSRFSQRMKDGGRNLTWRRAIRKLGTHEPNALIERWSQVAGSSSLIARPYFEDFKRTPATLLADFCAQVGVDPTGLAVPASDDEKARNTSLNAEGIQILQALNPLFPRRTTGGQQNSALRLNVVDRVLETTTGPPLAVPQRILTAADEQFGSGDIELVAKMGSDPLWQQWLSQPGPTTDHLTKPMTAARTAELLTALSIPAGPLDFSQPDWRPRESTGRARQGGKRLSAALRRSVKSSSGGQS
jgi:hypothetical protein